MFIENDDEDQYQNLNNQNGNQSVGGGAGGGVISGSSNTPFGNPSTINPIQTQTPQKFASATDYLKANQQQGETLGNQFNQNLSNKLSSGQQAIDTTAANIKNEVSSATPTFNPNAVSDIFSNPSENIKDSNKMTNYLNQANATYKGPTSAEASNAYQSGVGEVNKANQTAEELKTTGGRKQLLQDEFGVYGEGNKSLDQGLLQRSTGFLNNTQNINNFKSLQDYLNNQAKTINEQSILAAQASAKAVQDQTKAATQAGEQAFEQSVKDPQKIKNEILKAMPSVSKEDYDNFLQGLNQRNANIGLGPDALTQQLATQKEYDDAEAIAKLTGQPNTLLPSVNRDTLQPNTAKLIEYLRNAIRGEN